jgi:hypothetical protein
MPPDPEIGVAGDPDALIAGLRTLTDGGITAVVAQPTSDEPDLEGFDRMLGRDVRPGLVAD